MCTPRRRSKMEHCARFRASELSLATNEGPSVTAAFRPAHLCTSNSKQTYHELTPSLLRRNPTIRGAASYWRVFWEIRAMRCQSALRPQATHPGEACNVLK